MFDHNHYVPVLRWKRGEWNALRDVGAADRSLNISRSAKRVGNRPRRERESGVSRRAVDRLMSVAY